VRDLLNQVAQINPGNQAKLTILRKGKQMELTAHIGKRPKPKQQPN
jgi:serine protease DegQ